MLPIKNVEKSFRKSAIAYELGAIAAYFRRLLKMEDEDKTKDEFRNELTVLRQRIAELKASEIQHKRAERLLQALNQAAVAMEQALTPEEIFSAVAGELRKLGFSCIVFLADESQKRLYPGYWTYPAAAIRPLEKLVGLKGKDFPILIENVDVYRKVVWEKKTVFVEDVEEVVRQLLQPVIPGSAKRLAGQIAKMLKVSKTIPAPLIAADKVIGVLSVQSNDLSQDEKPAVTAFAHQMAAAWRKTDLLQRLEKSLAERKRTEEALKVARDGLERRVKERSAELVKSNEQLRREIIERK
ncbi:MAG: GAF domain-containing protein, partial [bacterium]